MAAVVPSAAGRRLWHPFTAAGALAVAAFATAGAVAAPAGPAWLVPGAWLLLGAASGFATSGST
jgi:hypothetical protein